MATELEPTERELIRVLIAAFERKVLTENPDSSFPFRVFAQTALTRRRCALGPLLSSELRERVQRTVESGQLTPESATSLHDAVVRELVPDADRMARVEAIGCPLIGVSGGATVPGADEPCCTARRIGPGCDAAAGRIYNAKTDGFRVWYAARMFSADAAQPAQNYGAFGLRVRTQAGHVLLHEMGHVLHLRPSTHPLFGAIERWYWSAAELVPERLRTARVIVTDFADAAEFVATAFAMDNEDSFTLACEQS